MNIIIPEKDRRAASRLVDEGASIKDVAKQYNVVTETVRRWQKLYGTVDRRCANNPTMARKATQEQRSEMVEWFKALKPHVQARVLWHGRPRTPAELRIRDMRAAILSRRTEIACEKGTEMWMRYERMLSRIYVDTSVYPAVCVGLNSTVTKANARGDIVFNAEGWGVR